MEKQLQGLTQMEVKRRIDAGKTNHFKAKTGSSNWEIFRRNVFNSFNMLNFAIFVALIAVQAWSNLFFFGIIVLNAFTGMMTELRARRMIDKLNLMNKDQIRVVRDGEVTCIDPQDIVLDDIMLLSAGEQVPSDAVVVDGMAELNEAMLTGESDLILKKDGKELLSGSYLVSGQVYAKVINVAEDNYANKLMLEAKTHKPIVSRILYNMDKIAKFTGKIVIPFGLALFFEAYLINQLSLQESVVTSSTALLGMLPKGIALLTITSLLTAVIKLGMKHILVQEMYSVETLARVDVLCLDKTGTITQGKMTVKGLKLLSERFTKEDLERLLAAYMQHSKDNNATAQAIRNAYERLEHHYQVGDVIPFSSDRKWGAMSIDGVGTLFLGAPEMLLKENPKAVDQAQARGSRVLILAWSQSAVDTETMSLPNDVEGLTLLEIADPIREDAAETLEYLRSEDVTLKIISGDNPVTVSHIAHQAGFADYQSYIDCSKVSDEELEALAEDTAIFGRVSPHQKKLLIQTLNANGHTTAMTGDGVNDVLALKEADCSIAMAQGSDAAKNIANVVLLDSNFASMPHIVNQGRRVVNNIRTAASMFLIKTMFSVMLSLLTIFFGNTYPFEPIQMSLISACAVGIPTFLLAQENNYEKIDHTFLRHVFINAFPAALTITSCVFAVMLVCQNVYHSTEMLNTACVLVTGWNYMAALKTVYAPLNTYRKTIIYGMQFIFFAAAVIFQKLLSLGSLDFGMIILVFILMTFAPVLIDVITVWLKGIYARSLDKENPGKFTAFIDKLRK